MAQIPIEMDHPGIPPLTEEDLKITAEEMSVSTLYTDRRAWIRVLAGQIRLARSDLRGPPGMLDTMLARLSSSKARKTTLPPST